MIETIDGAGLAFQHIGREIGALDHLIDATKRAIRHPQKRKRHFFVGENVDENATILENAIVIVGFRQSTPQVAHLGIAIKIAWVGIGILQRQVFGQFSGEDFHESVVVGAHHLNIEIIVPGNVALMPHRAEQGAGTQPIAQAVATTDAVDHTHHLRHAVLHTTKVGTFGIKTGLQLPLQLCIGTARKVELGLIDHGRKGDWNSPPQSRSFGLGKAHEKDSTRQRRLRSMRPEANL